MDNEYKLKNGSGCLACSGCGRQDNKLNTYDWMADIPGNADEQDMVEVQFKNTRKGYYKNSNKLPLMKGDIVAVEASPGHDIGTVTLTGRLVPLQMKKANIRPDAEIKSLPQSQAGGHGKIRRSQVARTPDNDSFKKNSGRAGTKNENR